MRHVFIIGYCLCIYALALGVAGANSHDVRLSFLATKVTDGDSIRAGTFRLRLYGIDAPETRQNVMIRLTSHISVVLWQHNILPISP